MQPTHSTTLGCSSLTPTNTSAGIHLDTGHHDLINSVQRCTNFLSNIQPRHSTLLIPCWCLQTSWQQSIWTQNNMQHSGGYFLASTNKLTAFDLDTVLHSPALDAPSLGLTCIGMWSHKCTRNTPIVEVLRRWTCRLYSLDQDHNSCMFIILACWTSRSHMRSTNIALVCAQINVSLITPDYCLDMTVGVLRR